MELEIYIHIPFCVRKCLYCDFLSAPADVQTRHAYVDALEREICAQSTECRGYAVVSVYIGGGTPSLLEPEEIARLLSAVRTHYVLQPGAEISMECNPGTADAGKLSGFRKAGVNRLSIGLQSANDRELQRLGRIHTWAQFLEIYYLAREAGFANVNVDLMSALPGQTAASFRETLTAILHLNPAPEHLSVYSLIVEEGTPYAALQQSGKLMLPTEDTVDEIDFLTESLLQKAGYERYEISNYALPGFACRHNCGYWIRRDYIGFGIGAASLLGECRFSNAAELAPYIADPLSCRRNFRKLPVEEQMEEFMFLGLRMTAGVSAADFHTCFQKNIMDVYGDAITLSEKEGLLLSDGGRVRLSARGLRVANYVMARFLF